MLDLLGRDARTGPVVRMVPMVAVVTVGLARDLSDVGAF